MTNTPEESRAKQLKHDGVTETGEANWTVREGRGMRYRRSAYSSHYFNFKIHTCPVAILRPRRNSDDATGESSRIYTCFIAIPMDVSIFRIAFL